MAPRKRIQYQKLTEPPAANFGSNIGGIPSATYVDSQRTTLHQYQSQTSPVFVPSEIITYDKWGYEWSSPSARPRIAAGFAIALMASGLFAPVFTPTTTPTPGSGLGPPPSSASVDVRYKTRIQYQGIAQPVFVPPAGGGSGLGPLPSTVSVAIQYERRTQYQSSATPVFVPSAEVITSDKWNYPWSEPVRQRPGLRAHLQQASIGPVLNPNTQITQTFESRWHQPWSEPVRVRRFPAAEQQSTAFQPPIFEAVTYDKWGYAWSEPIRTRRLPTSEQQSIAQTLFIETVTVDKWIYPWSEPTRFRRFPAAEQQSITQPPTSIFEVITLDKWIYPLTEPVRTRKIITALQPSFAAPVAPIVSAGPGSGLGPLPSNTSVDVRYKTRVQYQGVAQPVFVPTAAPGSGVGPVPATVSIGVQFERRTQYQTSAAPVFVPAAEVITIDKWNYAWAEPVRVKRGLLASEQQFFAADTTAIPTSQIFWFAPFRDPVRLPTGLKTHLQQAFIAPVLNPDTQITQGFESRWHQPWSEPVRFRRFPTSEQQAYIAPATSVFETITLDKWVYAISEPVRQKPGLKTNLQQAFIGLTLNPETQLIQDYESRWHQPWSEPVRLRRFPTAEQQAVAFQPPSFEIITIDKWAYALSEPVRLRRFPTAEQQTIAFTATVAEVVNLDKWTYPWSEPVRLRRFPTAEQQSVAFTVPVFEVVTPDKWIYPWSEPLRRKAGFGVWLQRTAALETPPFPTFVKTIPWFEPLNDPVRLKIGFRPWLQQFFTEGTAPLQNLITLVLSATEVNSDSAVFGISVYNVAASCVVSIKEIPAIMTAAASIEQVEEIRTGAVSVEELPTQNTGAVSVEEKPDSTGAVSIKET